MDEEGRDDDGHGAEGICKHVQEHSLHVLILAVSGVVLISRWHEHMVLVEGDKSNKVEDEAKDCHEEQVS